MTTIKKYLEEKAKAHWTEWDFGPEIDDLLGGRSNTTTAAELWTSIANGSARVTATLAWAQLVANKIEKDIINKRKKDDNKKQRDKVDFAPAALKAIGFSGRIDPYRQAKEQMQSYALILSIEDDGRPSSSRMTARQWLAFFRKNKLLLGIRDKTAINKISEWRKELRIE